MHTKTIALSLSLLSPGSVYGIRAKRLRENSVFAIILQVLDNQSELLALVSMSPLVSPLLSRARFRVVPTVVLIEFELDY
jgi:hypothetical protein